MVRFSLFLLTTLCFLCATFTASADNQAAPTPKTAAAESHVPMSTVLQNLRINGYHIVSKIVLQDQVYEIDTLTPQGKEVAVTMNANTGEITKPKENPAPHLSLSEVVKKLEGSGYHDISKIEYNGSKYVVRALDAKNEKVKLKVDGNSGDISKPWF